MVALGLLLFAGLGLASSDKRGLVFVPDSDYPTDNRIWTQPNSDLSWYYNYGSKPSVAFSSIPQDKFEFVPMQWGIGANPNDTTFLNDVNSLISEGTNVKYAMAFNEPDGTMDIGGSNISPRNAALAWVANFEPLAEKKVKLVLPAVTGAPSGFVWLKDFLSNCSAIVSTPKQQKNCTFDVVPVHWYGPFSGLASHIGERRAAFPDASIWVTEYAFDHQDLSTTQEFFNQTLDYFAKLDYIGRYAYFGAFRSKKSGVGPNASFLNNGGHLTDIGSWYLGFGATGIKPTSTGPATALRVPGVMAVGAGAIMAVLVGLL